MNYRHQARKMSFIELLARGAESVERFLNYRVNNPDHTKNFSDADQQLFVEVLQNFLDGNYRIKEEVRTGVTQLSEQDPTILDLLRKYGFSPEDEEKDVDMAGEKAEDSDED